MTNYPRAWFTNIVALLEKRAYHTYNILLFALFVASVRLFTEWAVGGAYPGQLLSAFLVSAGFYWLSFFAITTVLALTVAQPWRTSINVILVGIFLGIFPPLLDVVAHGKGFEYGYVWQFPEQWRWQIYNAQHKITFGEGTVLWAVIWLTTAYVWHKTRSVPRTSGALALAYGSVVFTFSLVATVTWEICTGLGWPIDHRVAVMALLQYTAAALLYLALQRRLLTAIAAGAPYAALLVAVYLVGAARSGPLTATTLAYALIMLATLLGPIAVAGGRVALDADDRRFFALTASFMLLCIAAAHSTALLPLLVFVIAAWRVAGRLDLRWLATLAVAAFALGLIGGMEHAAYGAPRWWIRFIPRSQQPAAMLNPFGGGNLAVMALLFAAFMSSGALYTRLRSAQGALALSVTAAATAAAIPTGLAAAGLIGWMYPPLGVVAGLTVGLALRRSAVQAHPQALAAGAALYLFFIAFALRIPLT